MPPPTLNSEEPANPLFRTQTLCSARKPSVPHVGDTAHAPMSGFTCGREDPGSS